MSCLIKNLYALDPGMSASFYAENFIASRELYYMKRKLFTHEKLHCVFVFKEKGQGFETLEFYI